MLYLTFTLAIFICHITKWSSFLFRHKQNKLCRIKMLSFSWILPIIIERIFVSNSSRFFQQAKNYFTVWIEFPIMELFFIPTWIEQIVHVRTIFAWKDSFFYVDNLMFRQKLYLLSERLMSLGIMGTQLGAPIMW